MKNFNSTFQLLLLFAVLALFGCPPHATSESDKTTLGTHTGPTLRIEGDQICLDTEGEEICLPFRNTLVKLTTANNELKIVATDQEIPDLGEFGDHPGLTVFDKEIQFEIGEGVLEVKGENYFAASLDGGDLGLVGTSDGGVAVAEACMTGINISKLTKIPCSGTVKVNPLDIKGGRLLFNSDIGTMIIVDAFDTLNFLFRNLNPLLDPQFMEHLKVPKFDTPMIDPIPVDPLDGEKYFTIGEEQLDPSQVSSCQVPCPVFIAWCNGRLVISSTNGQSTCTLNPGNCPFNIYMKNGSAKVVASGNCNPPKIL